VIFHQDIPTAFSAISPVEAFLYFQPFYCPFLLLKNISIIVDLSFLRIASNKCSLAVIYTD
jgi:hypothetical protein